MTKQRHIFTEKRKALAASVLAQKIGYLKTQDFPENFFENLPTQTFNAHKVIRPKNQLFAIQQGAVELWHTHQDMFISVLGSGSLFGELSLLGQTMLGCKAIAGSEGVTLGVISIQKVGEWIDINSQRILEALGPRLSQMEIEHYRPGCEFGLPTPRAGLCALARLRPYEMLKKLATSW